jgi:hypothetical protein
MNNQNIEDARRLFEADKPAPTISEYELEQRRRFAVFDKLKAERLARANNKPI